MEKQLVFNLFEDNDNDIVDYDIVTDDVPKRVKKGDIWQLGKHRIMCGDSTSDDVIKLLNGSKIDMVFTDPPYGMKLDTDYSSIKTRLDFSKDKSLRGGNKYNLVIGDNEDFKEELITTIFKNFDYCKEIFIWGADYYPELLKNYKNGNLLVWDKRLSETADKGIGSCFEIVWSKNKHKKDIFRVKWFGLFGLEQEPEKKRFHPTQKPIELCKMFLNKYSKAKETICDLYGGSGSTLIACEITNRTCYMMELDEHYVDVIIHRWETLTRQEAKLLYRKD